MSSAPYFWHNCCVVSRNPGSGKTTLLRILLGQETPTGGTVSVVSGTRIGYVPQYVEGGDDELVMDWLLA